MQSSMQQVVAKCNETYALALKLYNLDLSKVSIRFDLKGRAAGCAGAKASFGGRTYFMRFNRDMLTRDAFDHVLNDTVPHEIAHIVCFMNPKLGSGHDAGWAHVCRSLGGNGARYHQEEVVYGNGRTYEYVTDRGHKVRLSEQRHKKIQQGTTLTYRKGMGRVTLQCAYSIVGYQGRTLATPVGGKAATHAPVAPAPARIPLPAPVQRAMPPAVVIPKAPSTPAFNRGETKASIARAIMLSGYKGGQTYEDIIAAIMLATGHDRNLSRAYFKNNAPKLNIPASFYI